ncbi:Hsp33 family molecular chaperone HslO [Saccharospirillum salsuginis]|uniref:33 kDa chaperonin n=1 Tax=Saccharospirillum salsuginis TaxID=418750 RepID=A0A918K9H3_9GAMM|nr:Hsp33 family molecular chaperone HslO [Saccharospirillum salsuginis]GGX54144.1 33 kDa chaperonin [Saccharospirillum salsuginis]
MSNPDQTQRFLFDDTPLRGEITGLQQSYRDVLDKHNYPEPVRHLLGQFMAAVALLSDTLKFEGTLSLQVRGAGQVRMLMAECRDHEALRAIAQYTDDFSSSDPLLGNGQLAITIDPKRGKRYQGIVPIDDDAHTLARALEGYFRQSEQIRTRIWLDADDQRAAGMLVQAMPVSASEGSLEIKDDDAWDRVTHLADTLTAEELLKLDNETILHRLFHEEKVRLFPERGLRFQCTCSRERCGEAILTLGHEEAKEVVAEEGAIISDCQFCHQQYRFTADDVDVLFEQQRQRLQ